MLWCPEGHQATANGLSKQALEGTAYLYEVPVMSFKTKNKHNSVRTQGKGGAHMNLPRLARPQWSHCPLKTGKGVTLILLWSLTARPWHQ